MDRPLVVSVGLGRLFLEILNAALSNHDWRVVDPEGGPSAQDAEPEMVLVAGSGPAAAVIDRLRHARAKHPAAKAIVLGAEGNDADLVRYIEEGASGYVCAGEGLGNLLEALEMVRNNRAPSSGRITRLVMGSIRRLSQSPHVHPEACLTLREQEIFRLIQEGLSNKEIAGRLQIAPNTVKNHVHHLLEKLSVRNRHEAAWLQAKRPRSHSPGADTGTGE